MGTVSQLTVSERYAKETGEKPPEMICGFFRFQNPQIISGGFSPVSLATFCFLNLLTLFHGDSFFQTGGYQFCEKLQFPGIGAIIGGTFPCWEGGSAVPGAG